MKNATGWVSVRSLVASLSLALGAGVCQGQVSIQWIDMPVGYGEAYATDISADGQVVVGDARSSEDGRHEGFRWTSASGTAILPSLHPFGMFSDFRSPVANENGSVVASSFYAPGARAGRWSSVTGLEDMGIPDGYTGSDVHAISADGGMAAGTLSGSGFRAAVWNGSWLPLPTLPDSLGSTAHGMSADGSRIVGFLSTPFGDGSAVLWWDGGVQSLGVGGGEAYAISADGSTIVGNRGDGSAFIWTESTGMQSLAGTDAHGGGAGRDVSADGSVIVGDGTHGDSAFVWDAVNGTRLLSDILFAETGINASLHDATGISDDGTRIVGFGNFGDSNPRVYILTIPEPASLGIFAFASLTLLARRRCNA